MVKLRRATPSDRREIESVYERTVGSSFNVSDDEWRRCLSSEGVVIAEHDERLIGFGCIDVNAKEQVRWIFIVPEFQSTGIGSRILNELETRAWGCGLRSIRLHSAPGAEIFYRKHGYSHVSDEEELGHDHDGVEMIKHRQPSG